MTSATKVLVTGGSGFLAMRIIQTLLTEDYPVRTTIRSLKKKQQVLDTLQANNVPNLAQLEFAEADLMQDSGWDAAMQNCTYVMSVASPVFFDMPKDENAVIRPAVEGIMRILKAANRNHVKRVVMTANFGGVGFSNKNKNSLTTEKDWTKLDEPGLSIYEKSKSIAEREAWKYVKAHPGELEFTAINPVAILGPSMGPHVSGSFCVVKQLIDGKTNWIPNIDLNVVDVRDVAKIHLLAMKTPKANGQRFIASAPGHISFAQMAQLIRLRRPALADKLPQHMIPNWVVNVAALFNRQAKEGKLMLAMNRHVSTQKAKEILGWQPQFDQETAVLAAVDSLTTIAREQTK